jgi:TetR/AcrR family transcriptional regulator
MSTPATRDQILDAAETLFAAQGFARTTIKQIGEAAGVNSALLYYYFGDKERLYQEVLQRQVGTLVARTMAGLEHGSVEARLRAFLENQARALAERPHLPKLMMRELADHDASRAASQIERVAGTSFRGLCDLIREGQASGAFRADVDPRFAAISTVGQVAYFFMARPIVRVLLGAGRDGPSPELNSQFARHAADFALAALACPPAVRSRPTAVSTRRAR